MKFFLNEDYTSEKKVRFILTEDDTPEDTSKESLEQLTQLVSEINDAVGETKNSLTIIQLLEIIAGLRKKTKTSRTYKTTANKINALKTLQDSCVKIAADAENDTQDLQNIQTVFKQIVEFCNDHKGSIWELADTAELSKQYSKIESILKKLEELRKKTEDWQHKIDANEEIFAKANTARLNKLQADLDNQYREVTAEVDECLQVLNLQTWTNGTRLNTLFTELEKQLSAFIDTYGKAAELFKEAVPVLGDKAIQITKFEENITKCSTAIKNYKRKLRTLETRCLKNVASPKKWLTLADSTAGDFTELGTAVSTLTDETNVLARLLADARGMAATAEATKGIKDWKARFIAAAKKDLGLTKDAEVSTTDVTKLFDTSKTSVKYEDSETAKVWAEYYKEEWGNDPTAIAALEKIDVPFDQEILAYGYTAETNPFIAFLKTSELIGVFIDHPSNYSILHNAVAEGTIKAKDLRGTGELGRENIIFNSHLYTLETSTMREYLEIQNMVQTIYERKKGQPFRTFDASKLELTDGNFLNTKYANIRDFITDLFCTPGNVLVTTLDRQAGTPGEALHSYEDITKALRVCFYREDLNAAEAGVSRKSATKPRFSTALYDTALEHLKDYVKDNSDISASSIYQRLIWVISKYLASKTAEKNLFNNIFTDTASASTLDKTFSSDPDTALSAGWLPYIEQALGEYDFSDYFTAKGAAELQKFVERIARQGRVGKFARTK